MADAEATLRELLDKILTKLGYNPNDAKIKAINSGGANYTSVLFLITVAKCSKPELNLFAKVATVGEKMRGIMNATRLFKTECFVYKNLAKIYSDLEVKHQVPENERFVFPKFYGCTQELYKETVVLDNLVAKGYKSYNRFESVDWEYASAAVKALAQLHALSFAYQKEKPEEFEQVISQYQPLSVQKDENMKELFFNMIKRSLSVIKDEDARQKVEKFITGSEDLYEKFNRPIGSPVLVHGDFRPSNLMYKKEVSTHQIIPVDYQTIYSGCPATDLVYFIFMGSDAAFRARHYDQLLEHYYLELSSSMERLGVDNTEVYPREKFDSDLKEMLPYAVLLGVVVLPIITVEAENAPSFEGDADLTKINVQPNDLYAERFRGIVDDCVRWNII